MDSTHRIFTLSRIVGLVVIGLVVAGLAYLKVAPEDPVSVPDGARAGQLDLEPVTTAPRRATARPTAARSSCPRTACAPTRG